MATLARRPGRPLPGYGSPVSVPVPKVPDRDGGLPPASPDDLAAVIERNRGPDPNPPKGWAPKAGTGCPDVLRDWLNARSGIDWADLESFLGLVAAQSGLFDLIKQTGPIDHAGYRYEIRHGGISIRQL